MGKEDTRGSAAGQLDEVAAAVQHGAHEWRSSDSTVTASRAECAVRFAQPVRWRFVKTHWKFVINSRNLPDFVKLQRLGDS